MEEIIQFDKLAGEAANRTLSKETIESLNDLLVRATNAVAGGDIRNAYFVIKFAKAKDGESDYKLQDRLAIIKALKDAGYSYLGTGEEHDGMYYHSSEYIADRFKLPLSVPTLLTDDKSTSSSDRPGYLHVWSGWRKGGYCNNG